MRERVVQFGIRRNQTGTNRNDIYRGTTLRQPQTEPTATKLAHTHP